MNASTVLGVLVVALAGLSMGSGAWTLKAIRKLQVEHWLFIGMLIGLVVVPWAVVLVYYPDPAAAYATVPRWALIRSNIFACGWGVANVLCFLCFVRIGVALTGGILGGLGLSLGVMVPMIFKASGLFARSPDLNSPAGYWVLFGVAVMLGAVVLASFAGFGRDKVLKQLQKTSGGFLGGLIMVVIAGILSTGPNFAFAYSQGPIVAAMKAQRAGDVPATFAVWAVGMLGGALVNVGYAMYLMTRNKSWKGLAVNWKETIIPAIGGVQFCLAITLLGHGSLMLGALGASVGWGIYQAMQILGNQGVGFISGEWRGVVGTPRNQMYTAIVILIAASSILAIGNSFV
ncbi:MAG: hypothetical protein M1608_14975 [Candidatus Omnitrophica bacterium]|nr:hypothetical protein [Candidatus Omnitrophota bacterium]